MAEESHADQAPHQVDQPPTSFGVFYPENAVIAIIDDQHQAEQAAQALKDTGIPAEDIDLLTAARARELSRETEQQRSFLGQVQAFISHIFSDDASGEQTIAEEARQGHSILIVHAADSATVARVQAVLSAHRAHDVQHYGQGTVEDLL